jgi:hypothetical protein
MADQALGGTDLTANPSGVLARRGTSPVRITPGRRVLACQLNLPPHHGRRGADPALVTVGSLRQIVVCRRAPRICSQAPSRPRGDCRAWAASPNRGPDSSRSRLIPLNPRHTTADQNRPRGRKIGTCRRSAMPSCKREVTGSNPVGSIRWYGARRRIRATPYAANGCRQEAAREARSTQVARERVSVRHHLLVDLVPAALVVRAGAAVN